jgi:Flp pilus assembly protein TadB
VEHGRRLQGFRSQLDAETDEKRKILLVLDYCKKRHRQRPAWLHYVFATGPGGPLPLPYAVSFYVLLFVACVVLFLIALVLAPYGLGANLLFAVSAAYLVIVVVRQVLRRKNL